MNYEIYSTDLLNKFYFELFSTDFRNYDSPTQNSKTDRLFECDNFDSWVEMLIKTFVEDTKCDKAQLCVDISKCPKFIEDLRTEYFDLLDLCSDDED